VQKARVNGLDGRIYTIPKREGSGPEPQAKDLFGKPRVHQTPEVNIPDSYYLILFSENPPKKIKSLTARTTLINIKPYL
jgi:hypothetical protein